MAWPPLSAPHSFAPSRTVPGTSHAKRGCASTRRRLLNAAVHASMFGIRSSLRADWPYSCSPSDLARAGCAAAVRTRRPSCFALRSVRGRACSRLASGPTEHVFAAECAPRARVRAKLEGLAGFSSVPHGAQRELVARRYNGHVFWDAETCARAPGSAARPYAVGATRIYCPPVETAPAPSVSRLRGAVTGARGRWILPALLLLNREVSRHPACCRQRHAGAYQRAHTAQRGRCGAAGWAR
jgi:hypothetical protein